jgi:GMP synthase (glutamine-hydrolysing)
MHLKLLEPLREVVQGQCATSVSSSACRVKWCFRHPFPGPGLGVRVLGEVIKPHVDLLRRADAIFIEELRRQGWYERVSQAFAVFLPVRSVAVMGDARRYDFVIALRAVETVDFMTARWSHLPYEFLDHVSRRIINEVAGISRVTYDISASLRYHRMGVSRS